MKTLCLAALACLLTACAPHPTAPPATATSPVSADKPDPPHVSSPQIPQPPHIPQAPQIPQTTAASLSAPDAPPGTGDTIPSNPTFAPFRVTAEIESPRLILSSVRPVGHHMLAFNTSGGGSLLLDLSSSPPHTLPLSDHAQIACTDDAAGNAPLVAVVERDAENATFLLRTFELRDGGVPAPDQWHTFRTRGFIPDPGAPCLFLDHSTLAVQGTRLRDSRPPYHGLFTISPRKLDFWSDFETHVPTLVHLMRNTGTILMSTVTREQDTPARQVDALCTLGTDSRCTAFTRTAEHLFPHDGRWISMSSDGACFDANHPCLAPGDRVDGLLRLPSPYVALFLHSGRPLLLHLDSFETIELGRDTVPLLRLDSGAWLIARIHDLREDAAISLAVAELE